MRRTTLRWVGLALLAFTLMAMGEPRKELDPFGVAQLHASAPKGPSWRCRWEGTARVLGNQLDPEDPWFDTDHGNGRYVIDGKGVMSVSGETPRMYVHDPGGKVLFTNVEITLYGMRVGETKPVGWAGLMAYAKTDHRRDSDTCATRGYGARLTYDSRADFEKETAHGRSNGYVQTAAVRPWPRQGGMPTGVWIGYKFIVRDQGKGRVNLELWLDLADGKDGGDWKLLTGYLDEGKWGSGACAPGVDPAQVLSGPFPVVYLRSDSVSEMRYKWFSIREIAPLP